MESWIGVLGTILGVLVGGVTTFFITKLSISHEQTKERNRRQLEKLEKAHELVTQINDRFKYHLGIARSFLSTGKKRMEEPKGKIPFDELEMIISFYCPAILEDYLEHKSICQDLGSRTLHAQLFPPDSGGEKADLTESLEILYRKVESKSKDLKSQLSAIAQNHAQ